MRPVITRVRKTDGPCLSLTVPEESESLWHKVAAEMLSLVTRARSPSDISELLPRAT
ncbi:hypothetical protein I79_023193 [Cricetulus griseus]|uniref:Uncharacterized protein n=1 Tax=Cricetulus griseus TaxID=10029 RepID=G3IHA5_CRIGR|nr:hypothetical protein I79_023193 [Cricetulus griseus]